MTDTIVVSTDGSALGNPNGPMGWAWADHAKNAGAPGHEHDSRGYDAGGATNGTNQIGELCAVLEVLRAHPGPQKLIIESDSQYAINCSTKWVNGWKRNGWKNSQKKPVKNREIIQAIDEAIAARPGPVEFKWVKGHAGNAGNELVDELARTYASDCRSGARDGYLPIEGWRSLLNSEYSRGTDVPPDVQLVLDGKADAAALRADRGVAGRDAGDDAERVAHDAGRGAGRGARAAKPNLAELLAEEEGVPDYLGTAGGDAGVGRAASGTGGTNAATISDAETDGQATRPQATGTVRQPASAAQPAPTARPASAAQPVSAAQPASAAQPTPAARPAPTGLKVSGKIRFSPAPKTSPYYNGEPMHVHGYIAVDGLVDGDGNLTIVNADFLRA